jgi:hypothetical protein
MSIHDTNLHRAGLPSVETLTRRILRTFDRATASDVEAGATWYDAAGRLAADLANDSVDAAAAAVIIAHLSPRTDWERNVMGATTLIREGVKATGIIGANFDRAVASLDFEDPFDSFGPTAPKTLNFARNIAGDVEAVTVDVWAARVVQVDPETQLGRKGVYDAVAHAYRLAARRRGVAPATMQATTWIVARGGRAA